MPPKNPSAILSKSTFIRGLQCEKSLYLHKNRPFLRDRISPEQLAKFSRGTDVGVYARELFQGGVDASPATHFQMAASVVKTRELMDAGQKVIYEAAFEHAGVIIALDILVKNEKGWHAIEVKSSRAISETYLWDASLQYYVMKGAGVEISDFSMVYINTSFVRKGPVKPAELFKTETVLAVVLERQEQVGQLTERLKGVVGLKNSPAVPIGLHCHNPYPCDFIGHCWKNIPQGSVFDLQGIEEEMQFRLFEKGIVKAADIPEDELNTATAALHRKSITIGTPIVNFSSLKEFAGKIEGETAIFSWLDFKPAIPLFDCTRPYQPVLFSLASRLIRPDGSKSLVFTLAGFPAKARLEELIHFLEKTKTIVVFGPPPNFDFLLEHCYNGGEQIFDKFRLIFNKVIDISKPFTDFSIVWPGLRHGQTPVDILQSFKLNATHPSGKIKSYLEASIAIEKLATGSNKNNPDLVLKHIDEFQVAALANIEKLIDLITFLVSDNKC